MNREQKKKLSRAKRKAQSEKKERMKKELEELEDIEDLDIEELEEVEEVEKSYYSSAQAMSFSELDAEKDTAEKVEKVQETAFEAQDLIRNILWYPKYSPREKADAIKSVADEFSTRTRSIMESGPMSKEVSDDNLEALAIEATLARDQRDMSLIEGIKDTFTKAVLTSSAENKLSDSQFALVVERDGKKIRKYPIHDKAHVRNALARAAQMIKQGGEAGSDAKKALPKIRAAAKKMGIEMSMEKNTKGIIVEKDLNGDWRAVMWVSNNFKDRDGEIISEEAHTEYVDWVNKEENRSVMPVFVTWHTPGTARENPVDFIDYTNGFLIASAKLTKKEAEALLLVQKEVDLGMSHGSLALSRDPQNRDIITKYRMYEVSDLPLEKAANPFTALETVSKEVDMDKKEYLTKLIGEERAEAFYEKTNLKQKELQEAEVESKEVTEPEVEKIEEVAETKEFDYNELLAKISKDIDIEGLSEFVAKAQESITEIEELKQKNELLEGVVKSLSESREEELADMIAPKFPWTKRASESADNIVKDDDKILEETPKLDHEKHWLNELTGTTPLKVE